MRLKRLTALLLALVFCLALTACSPNGESVNSEAPSDSEGVNADVSGNEGNDIITLSTSWDFSAGFMPTLSPETSTTYGFVYWTNNIYDTLVTYDDEGEIVGLLAEDWTISEDGKTYTFKLKEGITFSDGEPLTAEAVKKSFETSVKTLGQYGFSYDILMTLFESIVAVDELTLEINLTQAFYATLNGLTKANLFGVASPAQINDDLTYKESFMTGTYGTGPYMYTGDFSDNAYTFMKNPNYWGEEPQVDSFVVKIIPDNDAKVLALRNGELDAIIGMDYMNVDSFAELSEDSAFKTSINDVAYNTRYLGLSLSNPIFADENVRLAIAHAIDQQTIASAVFNDIEVAAETFFPDYMPYCDIELPTYETDVELAKALLEQAGWTDSDGDGIREKDGAPLSMTLSYAKSLASIDNFALVMESQLEAVGFDVTLDAPDFYTFIYQPIESGTLYYTSGGAYAPFSVISNMNPNGSTDAVVYQWGEYFGESAEEGLAMLTELDSTQDETRVQELYEDILSTIAEENLGIPITYQHELAVWNVEKIANYEFYNDAKFLDVARIELAE